MHPLLTGLVDDASTFPPGNLPVPAAVAAHREHRRAPYAGLVGRFVVASSRLDELIAALPTEAGEPLELTLVVDTGTDSVAAAAARAGEDPRLALKAVEVRLPDDDLADGARRVVDALPDLQAYVELPLAPGWLEALRVLAGSPYGAKLRCGGETPEAFPTDGGLAAFLTMCVAHEVPFKLTAGLHHAVRHGAGGFEHHGFLNALLATHAAIEGADAAAVERVLAEPRADALVQRVGSVTEPAVVRSFFVSFGSCSIADPVADLRALGLLAVD